MDRLVKRWIPTIIALVAGLLVLLSSLFPGATTLSYRGRLTSLRDILVEWAIIVAAFAFLLGLVNLLRVHFRRMRHRQPGGLYSLALLLTTLASLAVSLLSFLYEPAEAAGEWLFKYVISPAGASLAALVVFALAMAAFRLLRVRRDEKARAAIFVFVVAVVLLSSPPLATLAGGGFLSIAALRIWIVNVFGMAGMRGMLLGVALGTVITALRVLWPNTDR
jgi:hypothetical protein